MGPFLDRRLVSSPDDVAGLPLLPARRVRRGWGAGAWVKSILFSPILSPATNSVSSKQTKTEGAVSMLPGGLLLFAPTGASGFSERSLTAGLGTKLSDDYGSHNPLYFCAVRIVQTRCCCYASFEPDTR
jgi:hypothetical protein